MKKDLGWLGYIGDEILPNYIGIIIQLYMGHLFFFQHCFSTGPSSQEFHFVYMFEATFSLWNIRM